MGELSLAVQKRSRLMYIFEAAIEYLISILVASSYLARLTKELGFSDGLTGILSNIISLGCLFQLLSLSLRRTKVKGFVIIFSIINQLLFMLLYIVPLTDFSKEVKIAAFLVLFIAAYLTYYFAHPKKIAWLMGVVDDKQRGSFTANKEIVSLLSGMAFTFGMGALIDHFEEAGQIRTAFILSAVVIFVLTVLHTLTMVFAAEKDAPPAPKKNFSQTIVELTKNRDVRRVTVVFILYYIAKSIAIPFYGSYEISELGMTQKFISAIVIVGSVSRILVSKFWGRYADKKSFAAMIEKCFLFSALAQGCMIFAVPSTGKVMFIGYHIFHGIAFGGINSALTNLIFDYVPEEKRADSLAITQAFAGAIGFLTTLAVSPLVTLIQANGNTVLGLPVYAQQLMSVFGVVATIGLIVYVRCVFIKKK